MSQAGKFGSSPSNSFIASSGSTSIASSVGPLFISFFSGSNFSVSNQQTASPKAFIAHNLYVSVATNTSTSPVTIALNVNGIDSALTVIIPALTTGVFSNLVVSVPINQGDLLCWSSRGDTVGQVLGIISMLLS